MLSSQHYSTIALEYLKKSREEHNLKDYEIIAWGNLDMMESLVDLFGIDRQRLMNKYDSCGKYHMIAFKTVMDRLERESNKKDAIFRKSYIQYTGIINRPTRCFVVKNKLS